MLSLPFILALVGAGVGLLVGILIFGEVSDAIQCPSSIGGGGIPSVFNVTSYDNLGTAGSVGDAVYAVSEISSDFEPVVVNGAINQAVLQTGVQSLSTNGEIYLGTTPSTWEFLSSKGVGSDLVSINLWINGDVDGGAGYPIIGNHCPSDNPCGDTVHGGMTIWTFGSFTIITVTEIDLKNIAHGHPNIPPDDSQWHMITATYDKSITSGNLNGRICIDGSTNCTTDITPTSWTGLATGPDDPLTIGSDSDLGQSGSTVENTFKIDDVTIWNGYNLTDTDIDNLYNSGAGASAGASGLGISLPEQVGHWSFDNSTANGIIIGGGGSATEVGSEQCEQAKDTAWTVIGIMPVALFFGLFALFSSFGKPQ